MLPNLERYRKDLESLIKKGNDLKIAMQLECYREHTEKIIKKQAGEKAREILDGIPSFPKAYQAWYSEAKALVKQMLPDRLLDFVRLYEKPKARQQITNENYRVEDYLQGVHVTRGLHKEKIVGPDAAISLFSQQLAIVEAVKTRFESSLFDIRQLAQADLFDSELDAAKELAAHKFTRAAGAVAGVVLERHLSEVCNNHSVTIAKKAATISDLNDALKAASVIDVPLWRFVQHLADIRNLCDHSKKVEPTAAQVDDLIAGVTKIIKTLF